MARRLFASHARTAVKVPVVLDYDRRVNSGHRGDLDNGVEVRTEIDLKFITKRY